VIVSNDRLAAIYPHLGPLRRASYVSPLNAALEEFEINTPLRACAFLAQVGHESAQLRIFEELDHTHPLDWCRYCQKIGHGHKAGEQYENRLDLGNDAPGDGVLYIGRSPIQLTGKANYRLCGNAIGVDLVKNPTLASSVEIGFRVAGWFWASKGLNPLADLEKFDEITHRVNGGYNGKAERDALYAAARKVYGI
jgi:putative chitinase